MSSSDVRPTSGSHEDVLSEDLLKDIPSFDPSASSGGDVPDLPINLHSSGSVSGSSSGDLMGSSVFETPLRAMAPDPILDALAAAEEAAHAEPHKEEAITLPNFADELAAAPDVASGDSPLADLMHVATSEPHGAAKAAVSESPKAADSQEVEEEVVYVNGPNWPMLVLASYASAVTVALIWFVIIPRFQGKTDLEGFTPGASRVAVGSRRTPHKVEQAAPIPANHMAKLGQPLKIGALEITPLEMVRENIRLKRTTITGKAEEKDGGNGALSLKIRVRNTSKDVVFAPLDEAFIRDRDNSVPDSFVELDSGERVYLYPLPVESEWSVVGQDFPELKPGEVKETCVVTVAEFPGSSGDQTWHLKLRTGLESTEMIGVKIPADK